MDGAVLQYEYRLNENNTQRQFPWHRRIPIQGGGRDGKENFQIFIHLRIQCYFNGFFNRAIMP